jgi:hypothetical protein
MDVIERLGWWVAIGLGLYCFWLGVFLAGRAVL